MTDHRNTFQPSGITDDLDASIAPYESSMLDARHRDLTRLLLAWLQQHCSCRGDHAHRHARDAFLAAAFESCCAPPGASAVERELCAKLTVLFFLADDKPAPDLHTFDQYIDDTTLDELTACYRDLVSELGPHTGRFESAVHTAIACMRQEQAINPDTITMARHREIRHHTVFAPAYIMCRRTARRLFFPTDVEQTLDDSGLLELTSEIIALANDLGSVHRESRRGRASADLNFVWHRAREFGDLDTAVQECIDRHNRLVDIFHHTARTLAHQATASGRARLLEYQQILHATINGNLAATRHLVPLCFPQSEPYLRQLREVPAIH